jgi:hypothetical protein
MGLKGYRLWVMGQLDSTAGPHRERPLALLVGQPAAVEVLRALDHRPHLEVLGQLAAVVRRLGLDTTFHFPLSTLFCCQNAVQLMTRSFLCQNTVQLMTASMVHVCKQYDTRSGGSPAVL